MRNMSAMAGPARASAAPDTSIATGHSPWLKLARAITAYAEEYHKAKLAEREFARLKNTTAKREIRSDTIAAAVKERLY